MLSIESILLVLNISIFAYVVSCVLMVQGEILEAYYDLLVKLKYKGKLLKWLTKPLGLCEKCLAGQIGFWAWLYLNSPKYLVFKIELVAEHLSFTACCIFFTYLIKKVIKKK